MKAWVPPLNLRWPFLSSMLLIKISHILISILRAYIAVFTRSVGVTATTDSTQPAIIPANKPRDGESRPWVSANRFLTASKVRNRTPALKVVPLNFMRNNSKADLERITHHDQRRTSTIYCTHTFLTHSLRNGGQRICQARLVTFQLCPCLRELEWILQTLSITYVVRLSRLLLTVAAASMPPATPPANSDMAGGMFFLTLGDIS